MSFAPILLAKTRRLSKLRFQRMEKRTLVTGRTCEEFLTSFPLHPITSSTLLLGGKRRDSLYLPCRVPYGTELQLRLFYETPFILLGGQLWGLCHDALRERESSLQLMGWKEEATCSGRCRETQQGRNKAAWNCVCESVHMPDAWWWCKRWTHLCCPVTRVSISVGKGEILNYYK